MSDEPAVHELIWTDETVRRFWSFYADKTHTYFAETFGAEIVRRLGHHVPQRGLCIDYGCGSGGLVAALLGAGYRVAAADVSEAALAQVAKRFAGTPEFLGAWHTTQIVGAVPAADAVFSLETIEHVTDPNVGAYFAAIAALVKPGGTVVVSTPNDEDIEAAKVFCPESGALFHPMQHVRGFDAARLAAFLTAHGLEPREVFATDFGVSIRRPKRWLADKAKRLLGMGSRPPHLVAVARRRAI
jgi:2-polyprenyl-3-methyl-5-hydroxy-6-metoxy-1,4-benzoquinol methylase